jgi:hypothetical protein
VGIPHVLRRVKVRHETIRAIRKGRPDFLAAKPKGRTWFTGESGLVDVLGEIASGKRWNTFPHSLRLCFNALSLPAGVRIFAGRFSCDGFCAGKISCGEIFFLRAKFSVTMLRAPKAKARVNEGL